MSALLYLACLLYTLLCYACRKVPYVRVCIRRRKPLRYGTVRYCTYGGIPTVGLYVSNSVEGRELREVARVAGWTDQDANFKGWF